MKSLLVFKLGIIDKCIARKELEVHLVRHEWVPCTGDTIVSKRDKGFSKTIVK